MKHALIVVLMASLALPAMAQAPGKFAWQTVEDRMKSVSQVSTLGPDVAGDRVDHKNGSVSFNVTDVSIPGNGSLDVAITRSYTVMNRKYTATDEMLSDWAIELPHISGVFAKDWIAPGAASGNRCSNTSLPPLPYGGYLYTDYWQGIDIRLPDGNSDSLQVANASIQKPTTGLTYPWVAQLGTVHVSCLSSIKNGTGEGFLAIMPDGTRVWYDWMAQYFQVEMKGNEVNVSSPLDPWYRPQPLRRNVLYATRVEDRFGNYVSYTYTNAWNAPGRLTRIQSSDGRQIDVSYAGSTVSSISDGTRTWTYGYATTPAGRKSLSVVGLPDGSTWEIGLSALTDAEIHYNDAAFNEPLRTCTLVEMPLNYAATFTGTVKHPAGALASYTFNIQEHGKSNVPVNCSRVTTTPVGAPPGSGNNTNDDLNAHSISANSLTLIQKQISGAGITTATWSYSYAPGISVHRYPGTTRNYPVCVLSALQCRTPPCVSDSCAGSSKTTVLGPGTWARYTYGNSFGYNEGLLLKVEEGGSETNILRTTVYKYDLTLGSVTKPYPASYGGATKLAGDGFQQGVQRPLERQEVTQQATRFVRNIDSFDYFANPTQTTKSSQPSP